MLILNRSAARATFSLNIATKIAAAALGFGTILAVGAWLNWQLTDGWLNAPRWLRFCALVPVLWIFTYAEEVVLGPVDSGWRRLIRFVFAEALRLRPSRGILWCYTRRLDDCVGVPTNLTRGMKQIAIVGGGPAGALCGERLATAGFEVTIFDERLAWE
jgi:NADPH-dependent 2,4-dienoyl-CoA reductase/sulfur reductase-like enzyme